MFDFVMVARDFMVSSRLGYLLLCWLCLHVRRDPLWQSVCRTSENLGRGLKELADDSAGACVEFRNKDFHGDLAEDFDRIESQLVELKKSCSSDKNAVVEPKAELVQA